MAQLASASGLGPEGPVFESQYPDFKGRANIFSPSFFVRSLLDQDKFYVVNTFIFSFVFLFALIP